MTSSATSSAGFTSNPKMLPVGRAPGRAETAGDDTVHSDTGFKAAFEAIQNYSREVADGKSPQLPGNRSVENWTRADKEMATTMSLAEDAEGLPAAGDLLLTGGALTPEDDEYVVDGELQENQAEVERLDTRFDEVENDLTEDLEAPQIAAASQAIAVVSSGARPMPERIDKTPAERNVNPGIAANSTSTQETRPAVAARTDPFEALRHLTATLDRQRESARPTVVDAGNIAEPEKVVVKSESISREERVPANTQFADRPIPAPVRDNTASSPTNLTVVEARQIPAVAPTQSNASAIVSTITGDNSWNAMMRGSETATLNTASQPTAPLSTLKIRLHPAELGTVHAVLRLSGDQLVIELKVETMEAYRQLSDSQNSVFKALKGQGYTVEQITVQHIAPDRSVTPQGQGNSQASPGLQNQPGQDSFAHSGRSDTGQENGRDEEFDGEGSGSVDISGSTSSRVAADGAVYL